MKVYYGDTVAEGEIGVVTPATINKATMEGLIQGRMRGQEALVKWSHFRPNTGLGAPRQPPILGKSRICAGSSG